MSKYLIRKNTIIDGGIKSQEDNNLIIPFKNIAIYTDSEDPSKVVLPSYHETIRLILQFQNATTNTKYTLELANNSEIFDSAMFNDMYNGLGIPLKDLTGNDVILQASSVNPQTPTAIPATIGDTILVIYGQTDFYTATFTATGWIATQISDETLNRIANLEANVSSLQTNKEDKGVAYDKTASDAKYLQVTTNIPNTDAIYSKTEIDAKITQKDTQITTTNTALNALTTRITATETKNTAQDTAINAVTTQSNTDHADLNTATTGIKDRLAALENIGSASLVTAYTKYYSDAGTAQNAGGTATKAIFNLADLKSPNAGSATSADFSFIKQELITVKIKFTVDGQTTNNNIIFNVNCGDAEPTIVELNDRNGTNANIGTLFRAQLAIGGTLTLDSVNVDGTPPTFSQINFPSITVNEITQTRATSASNIVTTTQLATTNTNVAANTASIATKADTTALTTEVTNRTNADTALQASITTNATAIAAETTRATAAEALKANSTDVYTKTEQVAEWAKRKFIRADGTSIGWSDLNDSGLPAVTGATQDYVDGKISAPTWKDITSTYLTRTWNDNDNMKIVEITRHGMGVPSPVIYASKIKIINNSPLQYEPIISYANAVTSLSINFVISNDNIFSLQAPSIQYDGTYGQALTQTPIQTWGITQVRIFE